MAELYLAYRYEKEIEAAMNKVEELRKLQHEADIARPVQEAIIKRFAEITGVIPCSRKYYICNDEKSMLLSFDLNDKYILTYDKPGSCKKNHPARISINPTEKEIHQVVSVMIENYISVCKEGLGFWTTPTCYSRIAYLNDYLEVLARKLNSTKIYLEDLLNNVDYHIDMLLLAYITSSYDSMIKENKIDDLNKARIFLREKLNLNSAQPPFHIFIENGEYEKFISENPLEEKPQHKGFCFA